MCRAKALWRRNISDSRIKSRKLQEPAPWRILPLAFRMLQSGVKQAPRTGGISPCSTCLCRPRFFPSMPGVYSRRNSPHPIPVNRQPSVRVSSHKKTASLRASGAQTERLFLSAGSPGCFPRTSLAVFFLELVAYLERTAYAFPRPRIAGGAKQEGDRNIF